MTPSARGPARGPLRGWGARRLLAAWSLYWLALALVVVAPPVWRVWRLAHDPARHGRASFGFDNGVFSAEIAERGGATWTASAHAAAVVLWLVVPPLLLFVAWLASRPRGAAPNQVARDAALPAPSDAGEFRGGAPGRPARAGREG